MQFKPFSSVAAALDIAVAIDVAATLDLADSSALRVWKAAFINSIAASSAAMAALSWLPN
jgi:hypothetical protein